MSSAIISPLDWQCPHCQQIFSPSNNLLFVRGSSCKHDICTKCITEISDGQKVEKLANTGKEEKADDGKYIEIACPIKGCNRGKIFVDREHLKKAMGRKWIDLGDESLVKREAMPETVLSYDRRHEIKKEECIEFSGKEKLPDAVSSSSNNKKCDLKSAKRKWLGEDSANGSKLRAYGEVTDLPRKSVSKRSDDAKKSTVTPRRENKNEQCFSAKKEALSETTPTSLATKSPQKGLDQWNRVKSEPKEETLVENVFKEETDDESRFSGVDSDLEASVPSPPTSTKCKLIEQLAMDYWSTVADPVDISVEAFMSQPLFHLNSSIHKDEDPPTNEWFSLFLREGFATPGFARVPMDVALQVPSRSYKEVREMVWDDNRRYSQSAGGQVAKWLKDATVGSFLLIRHEFPECPFCPSRLRENGEYIGAVYVIGVITKKILPGSEEERDIQLNRMGEFTPNIPGSANDHNFCLVDWRKMGMKRTLKKSTQVYMNSICQPTLARMCQYATKKSKSGASAESIRRDLWNNATIPITSADFSDVFGDDWIDTYRTY